jgi:hemerythrin-like domain-containing protein
MRHATGTSTEPSSIELALKTDHEELERLFEHLMANLRGADAEQLRARWLELDRALERHLRVEEELILPKFERACPADAERVRREHHTIRARLVELGVDLDLHSLCPDSARHFIEALRQHAVFEESVFYPWSQSHLGQAEQTTLLERLVSALHRGGTSGHEQRTAHGREWS